MYIYIYTSMFTRSGGRETDPSLCCFTPLMPAAAVLAKQFKSLEHHSGLSVTSIHVLGTLLPSRKH